MLKLGDQHWKNDQKIIRLTASIVLLHSANPTYCNITVRMKKKNNGAYSQPLQFYIYVKATYTYVNQAGNSS